LRLLQELGIDSCKSRYGKRESGADTLVEVYPKWLKIAFLDIDTYRFFILTVSESKHLIVLLKKNNNSIKKEEGLVIMGIRNKLPNRGRPLKNKSPRKPAAKKTDFILE
jgi:hypothetical protein